VKVLGVGGMVHLRENPGLVAAEEEEGAQGVRTVG
jgi:hypothetical protein